MGTEMRSASSTSSASSVSFPSATFPVPLETSKNEIDNFRNNYSSSLVPANTLKDRCTALNPSSQAIANYLTIIKSTPDGQRFLRTLDANQTNRSNDDLEIRLKTWIEDRNLISMMTHIFDNHRPSTELDLDDSEEDKLTNELQDFSFNTVHKRANEFRAWIEKKKSILKRISILDLKNGSLSSLPKEIANFSGLKYLDISNNMLITIPDSIGKLTNLKSLTATHNKLTQLPEALGKLTALEELDLSGNELTNLHESIGAMTSLATLHATKNKINPNVNLPGSFKNLLKLKHFCIENEDSSTQCSPVHSQIVRSSIPCKNALRVSAAAFLRLTQDIPSTQCSTSSSITQTAPSSTTMSSLISPPSSPTRLKFNYSFSTSEKQMLPRLSATPQAHNRSLSSFDLSSVANSVTKKTSRNVSRIFQDAEETQAITSTSSSKPLYSFSEVQMSPLPLKSPTPQSRLDTAVNSPSNSKAISNTPSDISVKISSTVDNTQSKMSFKEIIKTVARFSLGIFSFVKNLIMAS